MKTFVDLFRGYYAVSQGNKPERFLNAVALAVRCWLDNRGK